jgi:hypothetical protein
MLIREFTIHDAAREDALERLGITSAANSSCVIPTHSRRLYDGILSISRCDHYTIYTLILGAEHFIFEEGVGRFRKKIYVQRYVQVYKLYISNMHGRKSIFGWLNLCAFFDNIAPNY